MILFFKKLHLLFIFNKISKLQNKQLMYEQTMALGLKDIERHIKEFKSNISKQGKISQELAEKQNKDFEAKMTYMFLDVDFNRKQGQKYEQEKLKLMRSIAGDFPKGLTKSDIEAAKLQKKIEDSISTLKRKMLLIDAQAENLIKNQD